MSEYKHVAIEGLSKGESRNGWVEFGVPVRIYSLNSRRITAERLAKLIDEAIEAVPEAPAYRYRWKEYPHNFGLVDFVTGERCCEQISVCKGAFSNGRTMYYTSRGHEIVGFASIDNAKRLAIALSPIDPSEVES